jgi:hypothetical protein
MNIFIAKSSLKHFFALSHRQRFRISTDQQLTLGILIYKLYSANTVIYSIFKLDCELRKKRKNKFYSFKNEPNHLFFSNNTKQQSSVVFSLIFVFGPTHIK